MLVILSINLISVFNCIKNDNINNIYSSINLCFITIKYNIIHILYHI